MGVAFSEEGVVADLAGKDGQPGSLNQLRVALRVGSDGSYFVRLAYDD